LAEENGITLRVHRMLLLLLLLLLLLMLLLLSLLDRSRA
jgi:hypothetical protein